MKTYLACLAALGMILFALGIVWSFAYMIICLVYSMYSEAIELTLIAVACCLPVYFCAYWFDRLDHEYGSERVFIPLGPLRKS